MDRWVSSDWRRPAGDGDRSFSAKKRWPRSIRSLHTCVYTVCIYIGAPVAAQLISGRTRPVPSPAATTPTPSCGPAVRLRHRTTGTHMALLVGSLGLAHCAACVRYRSPAGRFFFTRAAAAMATPAARSDNASPRLCEWCALLRICGHMGADGDGRPWGWELNWWQLQQCQPARFVSDQMIYPILSLIQIISHSGF